MLKLKTICFGVLACLAFSIVADGQTLRPDETNNSDQAQKVASYFTGIPGTRSYENLTFCVKDGKRGEISYSYGKDRKEFALFYAGQDTINGRRGFKIQFPNNTMLFVVPAGRYLNVTTINGKYSKRFKWEYEGPINGRGTFCDACVKDDREAAALVKRVFVQTGP